MARTRITCPECSAVLKSESGFTPGETVCCPKCETYFPVEDVPEREDRGAGSRTASGKKKPARAAAIVADDDDDEYRPKKKKKAKRYDDEDEDDDKPKRSYKSSPLRFAVLGVLIIVMLVMGYFLYDKKMKERRDAARNEDESAPEKQTGGPVLPRPGGGPGGPGGPVLPRPGGGPGGPGGSVRPPGGAPKLPAAQAAFKLAPTELAQLRGVTSLNYSPDSRRIVTTQIAPDMDGKFGNALQVWDLTTGKQIVRLQESANPAFDPMFSPDGKKVIALNANRTAVLVWDLDTPGDADSVPVPKDKRSSVARLAFSPDGADVFVARQFVYRIALASHDSHKLATDLGETGSMACSPTAPLLVLKTDSSDKLLAVEDEGPAKPIAIGDAKSVVDLLFSGDGKTLGVLRLNAIELYETGTWKLRATLKAGESADPKKPSLVQLSLSRDGTSAVAMVPGSTGIRAHLWSGPDYAHRELDAMGVDISPDGATLAGIKADSAFVFLDAATGKPKTFGK